MRSLGPWLKYSLMAWAISAAIIFIGFIKGFDEQPLLDMGRNLLGAVLGGLLLDWLSTAWSRVAQAPAVKDRTHVPPARPSAIPVSGGSLPLQKDNPAIVHYRQGSAHARNGDLVRAIESFSRALRLNPIYVDALISRSIALHRSGDHENAIADVSEALGIDPNNAIAYFYRGSMHYKYGNYAGAVADYDQSLRLDPRQERVRGARQLAQKRLTEAGR
jgi:tetratricopeptide (TPR) repeat protein